MPAAGPRRLHKPTCGMGAPGAPCGQRAVSVLAVHVFDTAGQARTTPAPATPGALYLCVEHHSWLPHAVRPHTRVPDTYPEQP